MTDSHALPRLTGPSFAVLDPADRVKLTHLLAEIAAAQKPDGHSVAVTPEQAAQLCPFLREIHTRLAPGLHRAPRTIHTSPVQISNPILPL